ncbi:MAG: D-cysteine desulfhydrase family protein [Myxococcales bacterium]|nr:D-cysteine desulfhydrase family protein [Myxococcales bacterium]
MVAYPPSLDLARLDTPLQPLERLSEQLGIETLVKRDDMTGVLLSGNKVRKLEFLLAAAVDAGARGVITCGGQQSNHARATALSAARLGLGCELLLRCTDPESPPTPSANILLDRVAGAKIEWITKAQYAERDALMAERAAALEQQTGGPWYVVPEGGSNALGAWGYVRCLHELRAELGDQPATIVCAVGSGGTVAGLVAGCRIYDMPYRVVGFCVCDDRPTFQQRIAAILDEMASDYDVDVATEPEGIEIIDAYVGDGYALSRDEELVSIIEVARLEGIVTDPVYTGKALYGLRQEIAKGKRFDGPLVFLHTGGIYGLLAKAQQITPLL